MWAKGAAALAAGCTIVVKSSEKAPLSPAKLTALAHEAGFPPGVINFLNGHGNIAGSTLASHMDVRAINFTGSTQTGRKIQINSASSNLKRVILELGGKSPALVFDDAPSLQEAATHIAMTVQILSGQFCGANARVYVQENVSEAFTKAFVEVFRAQRRGDPLDPETQQGPQADEMQYDRVKSYLMLAKESRGTLICGGSPTKVDNRGWFIEPTVLTNVDESEAVQKEEVFGPFVTINIFETEDEAVSKANDSNYGLHSSVFTQDLSRAIRVTKAMESGMVSINCSSTTLPADLPRGGVKNSGGGREGLGHSIEEYLDHKTVMMKIAAA